jgi:hypothetical protein
MIVWLFSLFTGLTWADCRIRNLNTSFRIQENSKISLFDSGKSLSEFKIQDQGSLGTCYANAASAVLKTAIPGNPDISYMDSALKFSSDLDQHRGYLSSRYTDSSDQRSFIEGGYICNTVAALKNSGGVCPREMSILENKDNVSSSAKSHLVRDLGTYFDNYNRNKKDPESIEENKKNIAKLIDSYNFEKTQVLARCEDEKKREIPIQKAMDSFASGQLYLRLEGDEQTKVCDTEVIKGFQSFLGAKSKMYASDKIRVDIHPSLENEFLGFISRDSDLKSILTNQLNGSNLIGPEDLNRLKERLGNEVKSFFNDKLQNSPEISTVCKDQLKRDSFFYKDDEVGSEFLSDIQYQKEKLNGRDCENLIKHTNILEDLKSSEVNQCMSPQHLEDVLKSFESLIKVGETIDQSMLDKLTTKPKGYASQIKDILVPGCSDKNNLINMNNISCTSMAMCDADYVSYHQYHVTYSGPPGKCHNPETAKSIARWRIMKGINEGRALGISVCTAFFNDPNLKTDFCKTAPPGVPGHSLHALAVSGIRCVDGKIEYELVNSWGRNLGCPIEENKNSAIECSMDKDGVRDGKFWVKEDVLIENTIQLSDVVNNSKK